METIKDIVEEIREFADTDSQSIGRDVLRRRIQCFADRIEKAITNCNQLKMREALENSNGLLEELALIGEWTESAKEQISENKASLSAPPRNCDLYATPKEAGEAFIREACENPCGNCTVSDECHNSLIHECGINWLFAEAKGEAK